VGAGDALTRRRGAAAVDQAARAQPRHPHGEHLSWRLVGDVEAFIEPGLPFFIEWDDPIVAQGFYDRQVDAASHEVSATGIEWIELSGDPGRLRKWLGEIEAPIRFTQGPPGIHAIGIGTDDGEVVVRAEMASSG
jgi:hypothetical protein